MNEEERIGDEKEENQRMKKERGLNIQTDTLSEVKQILYLK